MPGSTESCGTTEAPAVEVTTAKAGSDTRAWSRTTPISSSPGNEAGFVVIEIESERHPASVR
jgi:hypothetical protein